MNISYSHRAPSFLFCRILLLALLMCIPSGVARAQTTASDYTKDLPSVERVKAEIKGTDESDTLARQAAVFSYLVTYIQRIKESRTFTGPYTPGETRMRNAYWLAESQIEQDYKKNHTPAEVSAWSSLKARYEINNALDWIHQLSGAQSNAAYSNAESVYQGAAQRAYDRQMRLNQEAKARASAQSGNNSVGSFFAGPGAVSMGNDPASVEGRRCRELGGTEETCGGQLAGGVIIGLLTLGQGGGQSKNISGLILSGNYHSPARVTSITFGTGSAAITGCGNLVADSHDYAIRKNGNSVQVVVQNEPRPIHLFLRPDGSLAGPGPVDVKGRVIVGYFVETHHYHSSNCVNDECAETARYPNYAPKIERCDIATLSPPQPAPDEAHQNTGLMGFARGVVGNLASPAEPGLRMSGKYSSPGGLLLDFASDTVTLDCGQAHVRAPYTVDITPRQVLIQVQNSGGPFTLGFETNSILRGSGTTTVNGRLITAVNGDDVTFTPHSETCHFATFTPGMATSGSTLAAGPVSAPPRASPDQPVPVTAAAAAPIASSSVPFSTAPLRAQLRVFVRTQFTGANPLVGRHVIVMHESLTDALRKVGLPVPEGTRPSQAMRELAEACHTTDCKPIYTRLGKYFITYATLDSSGQATLSANALTGPYFFFATVRTANGTLMWDVAADLVAGDNTVTLTAANAETLGK